MFAAVCTHSNRHAYTMFPCIFKLGRELEKSKTKGMNEEYDY